MDKRNEILARQLIDYSVRLKRGEVIYIEVKGTDALDLGKQLVRIATEKGAIPFWFYNDDSIMRHWLRAADDKQMRTQAELHMKLMKMCPAAR